ncbi:MAG: M24 family metallopeptidase [Nanoarchaeota archaeon]
MKLKLFQAYLKREAIELVFLSSPDSNITYFTQLVPSSAHFLITPTEASLYLTKLDSAPHLPGIEMEELKKDWETQLKDKSIRKVGVNNDKIRYSCYQKLTKMFPKATFVDVSSKLKELRKQKTEPEIKRISTASKITAAAFQTFINNYSPKKFKSEKEVAFFLEKQLWEREAELAFPTIVASSEHSAIPHSLTSTAVLKKGFLQFDFGAKYQNYCSDMSRIVFLGKINREQREHYDLLLKVQEETIQQIRLGSKFVDLDAFARKNLGKYSSYFVHSLGHGLGIDIHEPPALVSESKDCVENKQVFTIEPGIYFPKKYGLRIEDTILFDRKTKILTTAPKELVVLK